MSTRRSTRVRTATEEGGVPSGAPADTANHLDESPRKRQRSSRDPTIEISEAGSSANADAPDYVATSPQSESPIKKGPGRPRGRPPKSHASAGDDAAAPVVNGTASHHREMRSTRSSHAEGAASTGPSEQNAPQQITVKYDDDSSEHELYLDSSSSATLSTVLKQFAPDLLHLQFSDTSSSPAKVRGRKKAAPSVVSTLSEALDGRPMTLRRLRNIVLALRRPVVSSAGHQDASEAKTHTQRQLAAMTIVLSLIDEIARSTRQQQTRSGELASALGPTVKKVDRSDILDDLLDGDSKQSATTSRVRPPHKYALHMRLPGGDYFSQAVELDPEQASSLDTGAANLVEIEPPPPFDAEQSNKKRSRASDVPTLGSRRYRNASLRTSSESIEELRERRMGRVRPTADVYFGPYASFAPTYDSSDANISRETSALIWRTKMDPVVCASRKAWQSVRDESAGEEWEIVDAEEAQPEFKSAVSALDLDPSLDADLIASLVESAPSDAEIQSQLHKNAVLLDQLQDLQWTRLRAGYARWKATEKEQSLRRQAPEIPEDEPGQEEQEVARELLHGLSALVQLRPRNTSEDRATLVPADCNLQALSRSVAIDPALAGPSSGASAPRGYWGTLDGSTYGPQSSTTAQPPPQARASSRSSRTNVVVPSMQTNTTARLDIKGENNSHVRKINAATPRNALPPGVSGDVGGHGLLDRVMGIMGRQVAHQASVTAGVQSQAQAPQSQAQSSPAAPAAAAAMSPTPATATKMMPPPAGAGHAPASSPPPTMATRRSFHVPTPARG